MDSSFDLNQQEQRIESKIVVALERISQAFRVLLWQEGKENTLSPIQVQILIFLLFHEKNQCRVSYLAAEFNMTKATVSESVKALLQKGHVHKTEDGADSRSFTISLTPKGQETAEKAASFANSIEKPLGEFPPQQKEVLLNGLLKLIHDLNRSGVITIQRMCFTCAHYRMDNGVHYCKLMQSELASEDLRVDCPEHQVVQTSVG